MEINEWCTAGVDALIGAGIGASVVLLWAGSRFKAKLRNLTENARRSAAAAQKVKASMVKLNAELAATRDELIQQKAIRRSRPVTLAKTEDRLRAAYGELDALKHSAAPAADDARDTELTNGFAPTRPMYDAM